MDQQLVTAPRPEPHVGLRSADNQWIVVAILDPGRCGANTIIDLTVASGN